MSEYTNNNVAMSWDSEIENDSSFTLLPEGDYDFVITDFERKRFEGSAKMSPCPQAALSIKLFDRADPSKDSTTVTHNLFLNYKCEGLLCEFFTAIGDRKHGEKLKPNWGAVIGKSGRCKVGVRRWTGKDGSEKQSNEIKRFYEPSQAPAATAAPVAAPQYAQPSFTPGKW